ncbi:MAG: APC family permease [Candidatus Eremiobacteraeota bacterium]|nr:APC family permease [Candidatus Eremiobacteraeota bacterium]
MQSTRQLERNAVSGFESTLIAISSASPANGFATNTVPIILAVGLSGPGALLFGALPMFGIALAYFYLNAWRSDAGAAYSWVGRTLNPTLGFFAGWSLLVAIVLFMVIGSLPVASATLYKFAPHLATNVVAVTAVGVGWFIIVVAIVLLGIKATAEVQKALTIVQIGALLLIAALALAKGLHAPASHVAWSWFNPIGDRGFTSFWAGALVTIFYFWGWDISSNLTEETVDRNRTPGLSGIAGMLVILGLFVLTQICVQLVMTPKQVSDASSNLLVAYMQAAVPQTWGAGAGLLAVLVIIIATVAVLEISLVQGARTMFSMGRDRVLDERFARLHERYLTPWNATFVLSIITVLLFAFAALKPSVNQILNDTVRAIGILIAIYYGLSGIACALYYRGASGGDKTLWWLRIFWPVASALFVFAVAIAQLLTAGWRADASVVGLLLLGVLPWWWYRRRYHSDFYTQPLERAAHL